MMPSPPSHNRQTRFVDFCGKFFGVVEFWGSSSNRSRSSRSRSSRSRDWRIFLLVLIVAGLVTFWRRLIFVVGIGMEMEIMGIMGIDDGIGDKFGFGFAFAFGGGFVVVVVGGIWEMREGRIWWWWCCCWYSELLLLLLLFLNLLPATKRQTSRVENRSAFLPLLYRRRRRLCIIPTLHIHPNECMIVIIINLNPLISRPNSHIPTFPSLIPPRHHHPSIQPRLGHIPPRTRLQHFRLTIPNPTS